MVSNVKGLPSLAINSVSSDGFAHPVSESAIKLAFKHDGSVSAYEFLDSDHSTLEVNSDVVYSAALFTTAKAPAFSGDYSITPTLTVTCGG
ncbi:Secreted protein [Vibrio crassostreae]|uniref:Uncharacterized protein n=1 Tax=Vibrio crassostreae TaxID=246167 RepID=A0A4R3PGF8_9VIBR|nr:hypothetical protein EDB35_116132 [Vibrio crassostreae]TCT46140.1 hypothetical protein EDB39_11412 [Vibrio crassostreae]TCT54253.1 hypothetical protein EDB40_114140 [Vibrio crassostreae]TCT58880.1 hypothetical protein EDB44_11815 [Vibrio crassostreae]TCT80195.1 hypothetical protein EDB43_11815 [Vibrio crassostreae]